jgi:hypothetical protein
MGTARVLSLIFLLAGLVALPTRLTGQEAVVAPCKGSTVDSYDATEAEGARGFVAELQKLVREGDKAGIAERVGYPLRVNRMVDGKRRHGTIRDQKQFVEEYYRLFNHGVRAAILKPDAARCLFANDQGFMIGNGKVWFEETAAKQFRISALNP